MKTFLEKQGYNALNYRINRKNSLLNEINSLKYYLGIK